MTSSTATSEVDITNLLTQLKSVETDREKLLQQIQLLQEKVGKLTEGKKAEMQKALDTVINDWLIASVNDEQVRDEFKKGMSRLVEQTAEESGVWRVVCCASTTYKEKLQELEDMRIQMDNMKKNTGDSFANESSRKRGSAEISETESSEQKNIWEEFADTMRGRTYEPPVY